MEQVINIPASTWTRIHALAVFDRSIPFAIYNDGSQIVRVSTATSEPTDRSAGIPTYVKQLTPIAANMNVWVYAKESTSLTLQWEVGPTYVPEVQLVGGGIDALTLKIDELVTIQKGMLQLLEAAFEDSLSGRELESGEF